MELVFDMVSAQQFVPGLMSSKTFKQAGGIIGRAEDCDWVIPDRKRVLSSRHAEVSYRDGAFFLTDTSSNGIQLKDTGASLDKGRAQRIEHGSVYCLGDFEIRAQLIQDQLAIVPQLAYLAHRTDQRIFQHLTVPQIIAQVLDSHGIQADAYRFQLGPVVYPERNYCTQYDETDLHFIQRLCEEEGIHYHFEHSERGHVLVFGDDQTSFPNLGQPTAYLQDSGLVADEPVIKRLAVRLETRTSRVSRRDYDFEQPRLVMGAAHHGQPAKSDTPSEPDLEDFDYPGRFTDRARGKHLSQRALERHRSDYRLAEGSSDQPRLVSGQATRRNRTCHAPPSGKPGAIQ